MSTLEASAIFYLDEDPVKNSKCSFWSPSGMQPVFRPQDFTEQAKCSHNFCQRVSFLPRFFQTRVLTTSRTSGSKSIASITMKVSLPVFLLMATLAAVSSNHVHDFGWAVLDIRMPKKLSDHTASVGSDGLFYIAGGCGM